MPARAPCRALSVVLILLLCAPPPAARGACPRPCACYVPSEVHCTFRSLATVPAGISKHVERINLGFNSIQALSDASFAGLGKLELLMLHGNDIPSVPDGALGDLGALQVLKFSYNKLRALTAHTLRGLRSLLRLHVDHNELEFVHPHAFRGLTALRLLHLEGNRLRQLHPATFATFSLLGHFRLSTLRHLYLADNRLRGLPAGTLQTMPLLETLYLQGNPWACDCHMRWLLEWPGRSQGLLKCKKDKALEGGQLCATCASPRSLLGRDIQELRDVACARPSISSPLRRNGSGGLEDEHGPPEGDADGPPSPERFRGPAWRVSLNMSDEHGNTVGLACDIPKPTHLAQVRLNQTESHDLAVDATVGLDLACPMTRDNYEKLWKLIAYYSEVPVRLRRDGEPGGGVPYRQDARADALYYTGVRAHVRAEPPWLTQPAIELQLDRRRSTARTVWLRYAAQLAWTAAGADADAGRARGPSWVMVEPGPAGRRALAVPLGAPCELSCNVKASEGPAISWVLPDGAVLTAPADARDGRVSVLTSGRLKIASTRLADSGLYQCVAQVTDEADRITYRVLVQPPVARAPDGQTVTVQQDAGQALALPCSAPAAPDAQVSWLLPSGRMVGDRANSSHAYVLADGTLSIPEVQPGDGGYYTCVAVNELGADRFTVGVSVRRTGPGRGRRPGGRAASRPRDVAEDEGGSGDDAPSTSARRLRPEDRDTLVSTPEEASAGVQRAKKGRRKPKGGKTPAKDAEATVAEGRRVFEARRKIHVAGKQIAPERWADILARVRGKTPPRAAGGPGVPATATPPAPAPGPTPVPPAGPPPSAAPAQTAAGAEESSADASLFGEEEQLFRPVPTAGLGPGRGRGREGLAGARATSGDPENLSDDEFPEKAEAATRANADSTRAAAATRLSVPSAPYSALSTVATAEEGRTADTQGGSPADAGSPPGSVSRQDASPLDLGSSAEPEAGPPVHADSGLKPAPDGDETKGPTSGHVAPTSTSPAVASEIPEPLEEVTLGDPRVPAETHMQVQTDHLWLEKNGSRTQNNAPVMKGTDDNSPGAREGGEPGTEAARSGRPETEGPGVASTASSQAAKGTALGPQGTGLGPPVDKDSATVGVRTPAAQTPSPPPPTTQPPRRRPNGRRKSRPHKSRQQDPQTPPTASAPAEATPARTAAARGATVTDGAGSSPSPTAGLESTAGARRRLDEDTHAGPGGRATPRRKPGRRPHRPQLATAGATAPTAEATLPSTTLPLGPGAPRQGSGVEGDTTTGSERRSSPGTLRGTPAAAEDPVSRARDLESGGGTNTHDGEAGRAAASADWVVNVPSPSGSPVGAFEEESGFLGSDSWVTPGTAQPGTLQTGTAVAELDAPDPASEAPPSAAASAPFQQEGRAVATAATASSTSVESPSSQAGTATRRRGPGEPSAAATRPELSPQSPAVRPATHATLRPAEPPTSSAVHTTLRPSVRPTTHATLRPAMHFTVRPSVHPTMHFPVRPSVRPTTHATLRPNAPPTTHATLRPDAPPTTHATLSPAGPPTTHLTLRPNAPPTTHATLRPTMHFTVRPSVHPTMHFTVRPSVRPTTHATLRPNAPPTTHATLSPAGPPTTHATLPPDAPPTTHVTLRPAMHFTVRPSVRPTTHATLRPTMHFTVRPSVHPTMHFTVRPSVRPTTHATLRPNAPPTTHATLRPDAPPTTHATLSPAGPATTHATLRPNAAPTTHATLPPDAPPTTHATLRPAMHFTVRPSVHPTTHATLRPDAPPTTHAVLHPTMHFALRPSVRPATYTTLRPAVRPTTRAMLRPAATEQPASPFPHSALVSVARAPAKPTPRTAATPGGSREDVFFNHVGIPRTQTPPGSYAGTPPARRPPEPSTPSPRRGALNVTPKTEPGKEASAGGTTDGLPRGPHPQHETGRVQSVPHQAVPPRGTARPPHTTARHPSAHAVTFQPPRPVTSKPQMTTLPSRVWPEQNHWTTPRLPGTATAPVPWHGSRAGAPTAVPDRGTERAHGPSRASGSHGLPELPRAGGRLSPDGRTPLFFNRTFSFPQWAVTPKPPPATAPAPGTRQRIVPAGPYTRIHSQIVLHGDLGPPAPPAMQRPPVTTPPSARAHHAPLLHATRSPAPFATSSGQSSGSFHPSGSKFFSAGGPPASKFWTLGEKPHIVTQSPQTVVVAADTDAVLPCEATGKPKPVITWTKVSTGALEAPGARAQRFEVQANGSLVVRRAQAQDGGRYLCTAENPHGADRALLQLSVGPPPPPPRIAAGQHQDVTVSLGDTIAMECLAKGTPAPHIAWIFPDGRVWRAASPAPGRVTLHENRTLSIRDASFADSGVYRCVASNAAGADSLALRLHVAALPPVIQQEARENISLPPGLSVHVHCSATAAPRARVRWVLADGTHVRPSQFVRGRLFVFPNGTLHIRHLAPRDSGRYECVAANPLGAARRTVQLSVQRAAAHARITASSPRRTDVRYGATLRLDCRAAGEPGPRILWRLPSRRVIDALFSFDPRVRAFANGTLVVTSVTDKDAGDYLCVARNQVGDDSVALQVHVVMTPARIEHRAGQDHRVSYGADLRVDCVASGLPDPEIAWALPDGSLVYSLLQSDSGGGGGGGGHGQRHVVFDNGTLYLNEVGMREAGAYTCFAENRAGRDEMTVRVEVLAEPAAIRNKTYAVVRVPYGDVATVACEARGEPAPRVTWLSPTNKPIPAASDKYRILEDGTLRIRKAQRADSGNYTCVVRNGAGEDRKVVWVHVTVRAPTINGKPDAITTVREVAAGGSRKLIDCRAEGVPPPRVLWAFPEGVVLPAPYYGHRVTVHRNGTLDIKSLRKSDSVQLACIGRNEGGEARLLVQLTVLEPLEKPAFRDPLSEQVTAAAGRTVSLNCSAAGRPPPTLRWVLPNGTELAAGRRLPRVHHQSDGRLHVSGLSPADAGAYRCVARNAAGHSERLVSLQVEPREAPAGGGPRHSVVSVLHGETLRLPCPAPPGRAALASWTLPGGALLRGPQAARGRVSVGDNGTLTVREASVFDRGTYVCHAAAEAGPPAASYAVIVVAYPPRITSEPAPVIYARPGQPVALKCMAVGVPRAEVSWELPDRSRLTAGPQARALGHRQLQPQGTLTLQPAGRGDAGFYRCTARNVLGSDSKTTYVHVY